MVKDFIDKLIKLRNSLININPSKEANFNKDITKIFKFLRESYEINKSEINSKYTLKKLNNTTQTSFSLKGKAKQKNKFNRNSIINCQVKINYFLTFESEIKKEKEILKKIKELIGIFLKQENKNLSSDWDLIVNQQLLKNYINKILNNDSEKVESNNYELKLNQETINKLEAESKEIEQLETNIETGEINKLKKEFKKIFNNKIKEWEKAINLKIKKQKLQDKEKEKVKKEFKKDLEQQIEYAFETWLLDENNPKKESWKNINEKEKLNKISQQKQNNQLEKEQQAESQSNF